MKIIMKFAWLAVLCIVGSGCAEIARSIHDPSLENSIKGKYLIYRNESGEPVTQITYPSSTNCRYALRGLRKYDEKFTISRDFCLPCLPVSCESCHRHTRVMHKLDRCLCYRSQNQMAGTLYWIWNHCSVQERMNKLHYWIFWQTPSMSKK